MNYLKTFEAFEFDPNTIDWKKYDKKVNNL